MGWIDSRTYYIKRRKSKVWDFSLHAGYGNISYGDSSSETQIRYNFAQGNRDRYDIIDHGHEKKAFMCFFIDLYSPRYSGN